MKNSSQTVHRRCYATWDAVWAGAVRELPTHMKHHEYKRAYYFEMGLVDGRAAQYHGCLTAQDTGDLVSFQISLILGGFHPRYPLLVMKNRPMPVLESTSFKPRPNYPEIYVTMDCF